MHKFAPKCPRIEGLEWLQGKDLNLRPSGYELSNFEAKLLAICQQKRFALADEGFLNLKSGFDSRREHLQAHVAGRKIGIKSQRSVKTRSGKPRALVSSIFFSSGLPIARRRCIVSLPIQPFSQEGKIAVTTG